MEREPIAIRALHAIVRHWPLPRGKVRVVESLLPLLRGRRVPLTLEPGLMIPVDLAEFGPRIEFIVGPPPQWELAWQLITPGANVIDAGANIGLWALRAARRAGREGRVHCFEPVSRNSARLRTHARMNGLDNVRVHNVALAERPGRAVFYEPPPEDSGKGRLARTEGLGPGAEVETTSIDAFRSAHEIDRLAVIKLDVEGAEELVLRGARETLAGGDAPVVLFEAAKVLAESMGSSCQSVKRLLGECGYQVYRFDGWSLEAVGPEEEHVQADLFAFKPRHLASHPVLTELLAGH